MRAISTRPKPRTIRSNASIFSVVPVTSTITEIAERLGRTPAQVVLRWHLQHGNVVIPKSVTPARIRENFELFDFELAPQDVEKIDNLDRGEAGRQGPHPDAFAHVPK